jgi:hypothetical protein
MIAADERLGIFRAARVLFERQHPQNATGIEVQVDFTMGPLRKTPAGISTTPPPAALAASMVDWIAVVLVETASPAAP